jgi:FkbM family methyltransferase
MKVLCVKGSVLKPLIMGNIAIKLPNDIKIFINDEATVYVNIPDCYLRREYMRHPDHVPAKGWTVLDIGAHVGIYTLWAARRVGDEGLVVAFEPNPLAFRWLVNNIELNKVRNVKAVPYALGDEICRSVLYVAGENIGASSLIKNHLTNNPSGKYPIIGSFSIQVLTLDYIIDRSITIVGRSLGHIDLAKIDVEGYEMRVLRGAEKTLDKDLIERFIIEVHTDQVNTKELIKTLTRYDYALDKVIRFNNIKDIVYMRRKR